MAMDISGISKAKLQQYAGAITGAIGQADAFLPLLAQGARQLDEFHLDAAALGLNKVGSSCVRSRAGQGTG